MYSKPGSYSPIWLVNIWIYDVLKTIWVELFSLKSFLTCLICFYFNCSWLHGPNSLNSADVPLNYKQTNMDVYCLLKGTIFCWTCRPRIHVKMLLFDGAVVIFLNQVMCFISSNLMLLGELCYLKQHLLIRSSQLIITVWEMIS